MSAVLAGPARGDAPCVDYGERPVVTLDTSDVAYGVAVAGQYALVATGYAGLSVIDLESGWNARQAGVLDLPGTAVGVAASGSTAFVAALDAGVFVVSFANPAAPVVVGSADTPGSARGVALWGDFLMVADGAAGVTMVSLADPAHPRVVRSLDTPGFALALVAEDDRLFVADGSAGITVIDLADPAHPYVSATASTGDYAYDICRRGEYLYVADGNAGLGVVDITAAGYPRLLAGVDLVEEVVGVACAGSSIAVALRVQGGVAVYDVTDPSAPQFRYYRWFQHPAFGVAASGARVFVANGAAGLQILEPDAPAVVAPVGTLAQGSWRVAATVHPQPLAAVSTSGGLRLVDVSDPSHPTQAGFLALTPPANSLVFSGEHLYVVGSANGLNIINVADPAAPVLVAALSDAGGWDVDVEGGLACVAGYGDALITIDVSDPAHPRVLSRFWLPGAPLNAVDLVGDLAYVAFDTGGFGIVDLSTPSTPVLLGVVDTSGQAMDVVVSGNLAFVCDNTGLLVIDVSDPLHPLPLDRPLIAANWWSVAAIGVHAYVRTSSGVQVFDAGDPRAVRNVGYFRVPAGVNNLAVSGDLMYAATPSALLVLPLQCQPVAAAPEPAGRAAGVRAFAFPNPTSGGTSVRFVLGAAGPSSVRVYDMAGRLVRTLLREDLAAGGHEVAWDGRNEHGRRVGAGVYLLRINGTSDAAVARVVLLD